MSSTKSNPTLALWAKKLFALLSNAFVVTTTTSSDDSSPSEGTGTSTSEGANPPPTSTNMLNSHHEVKLPSLANVMPQLAEIDHCFHKIMRIGMRENRLSVSNLFSNEPDPNKYSLRVQALSPKSLNDFLPRRQHQWIIYNIQLKVGDSALRPFTTIALGHLHYDNNMTTWIIVLDRLGNLFALRSEEIDDEELEYSDPELLGGEFEAEVVDAPAFGDSLLAVYLGPFEKLQGDYSTTASSLSSIIPLDKVTSWESFEPSRKMILEPAEVLCHDLASVLRDTSSHTSTL